MIVLVLVLHKFLFWTSHDVMIHFRTGNPSEGDPEWKVVDDVTNSDSQSISPERKRARKAWGYVKLVCNKYLDSDEV